MTGQRRGPRTWPPAHVTEPGIGELELGNAFQPGLQRDPQLEAGQVRTGAAVDAGAERDVAVVLAVEDHVVGVLEHVGVAVGGRERHQHPIALVDRTPGELDVLARQPRHRDRRVRAQQLLDGHRPDLRPLAQLGTVFGVLGEVPQRRSDRRPRGVDPGDEHQVARAEDVRVGDRVAVDLALRELGDQVVVARVGAAVGDLLHEELDDLHAIRDAHHRILEPDLQHAADPRRELVGAARCHAEHRGDDPDRDLLRVVGGGVGPAGVARSRRSAGCRGHACPARTSRPTAARRSAGSAAAPNGVRAGPT